MDSKLNVKTAMIGIALAGGVAFSTVASAGESIINQNIAAVFAPDSRPTASAAGQVGENVSLLDGIVESWRDPSRSTSADAAEGRSTMAATRTSVTATRSITVRESLRDVFNAYSAD